MCPRRTCVYVCVPALNRGSPGGISLQTRADLTLLFTQQFVRLSSSRVTFSPAPCQCARVCVRATRERYMMYPVTVLNIPMHMAANLQKNVHAHAGHQVRGGVLIPAALTRSETFCNRVSQSRTKSKRAPHVVMMCNSQIDPFNFNFGVHEGDLSSEKRNFLNHIGAGAGVHRSAPYQTRLW